MRSSKLISIIISSVIVFLFTACIDQTVVQSTETVILPTIGNLSIKESTKTVKATVTPIPTKLLGFTSTPTEESITKTPNPFFTPTPTERVPLDVDINPLTGMRVENFESLFRRPVMVKISNYPREIRPQSGLSRADIVFEYYMGQGMNRFLAIFYGNDAEWAGPIRSGRLVDAQLAQMYQGILVYGGADERVNAVITDPDILGERAVDTRINEVCPPICGEDTHSLEGVFVDTAELTGYAKENGFEEHLKFEQLESAYFSDEPEGLTSEAVELMVDMSEVCKSQWVYDSDLAQYLRWEETEDFEYDFSPSIDQLSLDAQIGFENIIVLYSDYVVYDMLLHDIEVVYEDKLQPAIMFRDGSLSNGFWNAKNEDTPLLIVDEYSEPYLFKPGKTWYIFVTAESEFISSEDGSWILDFSRP